ncbi:MAG: hypothetical protein H6712_06115 [Myxococcales bacterium]|nr:hypothetical protein [Myxococcales bacterium]MCB9713412.1 hypothetical protein [Myxococcales bacterium]
MLASVAAAHALAVVLAAQRLGLGFDARVQVNAPPPLLPGAEGELSVTILDTPWPQMPLLVRLSSARVVLPDNRLGIRDVVDPQAQQPRVRARFFAPAEPGRHVVEGLVEYVTCDEDRCRPRRTRVVWQVEVRGPE